MKAVVDLDACAAPGIFARRHRLDLEAQVMQARRTGEPRIQSGVEKTFALRQIGLGVIERQVRDKVLGADADIAREETLKMKRRKISPPPPHLPAKAGRDSVRSESGSRDPCGASWRRSHRRKVRLSWAQDGPGRRLLRPVSCADQPGVSRARRSASFSVCANDARSSGARKVPIFRPFPWLQTINWLQ